MCSERHRPGTLSARRIGIGIQQYPHGS
jgi:hypothetical protein